MIYLASSWRNPHYKGVLERLRASGFKCYDWRDEEGFHWSEVMGRSSVEHWTDPVDQTEFVRALFHPRAIAGFHRDMSHLREAEVVVLLLPCGKSAHLEAGWAAGNGIPLAVYLPEPVQPELMYGMADLVTVDLDYLVSWLGQIVR